jgi:hypothetical protein
MRINRFQRNHGRHVRHSYEWRMWPILFVLLGPCVEVVTGQDANPDNLSQQIQKLTDAIASTQAQLEQSQRQISELQKQLKALQLQVAQSRSAEAIPESSVSASSASTNQREPTDTTSALQDIHDRQVMQESQIATLEQTKVESESKYPVKITGLLLFNAFVNTQAVDMSATPTLAVGGPGSTGFSVRQTVLGFDARGPHLFGASSYADLRVDFDGVPQSSNSVTSYPGPYSGNATLLRLRTAHAGLKWEHTEAYFSLDHPIFSPDTPTSLTAIAEPALAWSGNLWTWNPQVGMTQEFPISPSSSVQLQAALVSVGDAPLSPTTSSAGMSPGSPPSTAEQSRWPGVEARVALLGSRPNEGSGNHFGLGGYFAPHRTSLGHNFDSWAATADARLLIPGRLELTGSFYRGLALGGLGGGAYKDFVYRTDPDTGAYYLRPLDDVGGWAQLKEKINERVQLNGAFGIDNAFSGEVQRFAGPTGTLYQNLSRNRTFTGNVIYSPSAYLLFSLEYRHLESSPVLISPAGSNVIGLGAGFKF